MFLIRRSLVGIGCRVKNYCSPLPEGQLLLAAPNLARSKAPRRRRVTGHTLDASNPPAKPCRKTSTCKGLATLPADGQRWFSRFPVK